MWIPYKFLEYHKSSKGTEPVSIEFRCLICKWNLSKVWGYEMYGSSLEARPEIRVCVNDRCRTIFRLMDMPNKIIIDSTFRKQLFG
jgi:hypothetical protein